MMNLIILAVVVEILIGSLTTAYFLTKTRMNPLRTLLVLFSGLGLTILIALLTLQTIII